MEKIQCQDPTVTTILAVFVTIGCSCPILFKPTNQSIDSKKSRLKAGTYQAICFVGLSGQRQER